MSNAAAWSGIDVGKHAFEASWVDEDSCIENFHLIKRCRFERSRNGVKQYLKWLDARSNGQSCRVAMEATGRYSVELIDWLNQLRPELAPAMVHPPKAFHYHRSLGLRNKNDAVDARSLGLFGKDRQPQAYESQPTHYRELRELKRLRDQMRDNRTLTRQQLSEQPESKQVRRSLRAFLRHVERQLENLDQAIAELTTSVDELKRDCELLTSIEGVAEKTVATVLGEMGDLRRFTRSRQVAAWAGLSPRQNTSGTLKKPTRIHRGGNAVVRKALYLPALTACRNPDSPLGRFYRRLVARGLSKKAAVVAVMRKLLVLMRALLITNTPYDPNYSRP